jgi:hypothetical protein
MRNIYYVTILSFFCVVVHAQEAITTLGSHAENSTAIVSWTIGQVSTETIGNSNYKLTQGIHQVSLSVTAIDEVQNEQIAITAFLNPTTHIVRFYTINC